IYTAADEIRAVGGEALPLVVDIRHEAQVTAAVAQAVETFGGIDICVNNASAIFLAGTLSTPMKRFDLMHEVNTRGTFLTSQATLPHLLKSENPHILNLSPPLNLAPKWFGPHCAYTIAKYGMSLCVLGMAEEFKGKGVAVNALWPRTTIDTAAVRNILGGEATASQSRTPAIVADAAHWILTQDSRECTGQFFIDEDVLKKSGVSDIDAYSVTPGAKLLDDFFI
ncbi:MAG: SDR family oxidoreductase, partial [Bradymonadia bacterium]